MWDHVQCKVLFLEWHEASLLHINIVLLPHDMSEYFVTTTDTISYRSQFAMSLKDAERMTLSVFWIKHLGAICKHQFIYARMFVSLYIQR